MVVVVKNHPVHEGAHSHSGSSKSPAQKWVNVIIIGIVTNSLNCESLSVAEVVPLQISCTETELGALEGGIILIDRSYQTNGMR